MYIKSNMFTHSEQFPCSINMSNSKADYGAAATCKIECFVIIVNGRKPLTIITKCSIFDVAAVLDPSLQFNQHIRNTDFGHVVYLRPLIDIHRVLKLKMSV